MVGDVMKDAVLQNINNINNKAILENFNLNEEEPFYFLTLHRQENTDNVNRFKKVFDILKHVRHKVIFAIHPRTKKILNENKFSIPDHVILIEPVNYIECLALQKSAKMVITDSGGIQKEAYFLHTPCITLRNETEWVETVEAGMNSVVGIDLVKFKEAEKRFLIFNNRKYHNDYYGDGKASSRIVKILKEKLI